MIDALIESPAPPAVAPHALPTGLVLLESAAAALRAFLADRGLGHYAIFHAADLDLDDLDRLLPRLSPAARWQDMPLTPAGEQPRALAGSGDDAPIDGVGVLHLPDFHFALARWNWLDHTYNLRETTVLAAAPDRAAYRRLHDACVALRRRPPRPVWEIVRSANRHESAPRPATPWSDLLLAPPLAARIDAEVASFFTPAVADLYRALAVPYRRGVLMHGPPGNGKTSIIKAIAAAAAPDVYAIILRPTKALDDDDLRAIFRRWQRHAPAMLVIEDLDHLLDDYINLSHFLNHVDGIDGSPTGGLLLVATTNHPEELDPALSNRPGRFDVVIEIPGPDAALRATFFRTHLPGDCHPARDALVTQTAGLSFSHLHEIVRLSGLLAINDRATARTPDHWSRAAHLVAEANRTARQGFPTPPEVPFGLAQFRRSAGHNSTD